MSSKAIVNGHRMRKRFGQNFLNDANIITRITRSVAPKETDRIVEIGPGQGAITEDLVGAGAKVTAVELDRDLIPWLVVKFEKDSNFDIVNADALKTDFSTFVDGEALRIVGNLPYNISTPLIFHLLSFSGAIKDMHFMLQKEVVDRMAAGPGDNNYGRLSVMTQYLCQVIPLVIVPPESFDPPPKVDSAIVRLVPRAEVDTLLDEAFFATVVRTAFNQRRKTLRNSLKPLLQHADIDAIGIDLSLRPENISVAEYVALANHLAQVNQAQ